MKKVPREIKHKYPGSWLYTRKVLEWTFKPELRSQLPLLLRFFCLYSRLYFRLTDSEYFRGGRSLFLFITYIQHKIFALNFRMIKLPGYEICIDLTDPRFLNVVNEFLNENAPTRILTDLLAPGDTFIDIGANHGSFSVVASRIIGKDGMVVAVEAQPRMAMVTEKSLGKNAYCPFEVYQTAVGDREEEIDFFIPNDTSGSAGIFITHSAKHYHKLLKLRMVRFDDLTDWKSFPGNVVIKLDIEGSEYAFLKGAERMIRSRQPSIIMEINPSSIKASGIDGQDLLHLLFELGYNHFSYLKTPEEKKDLHHLNLKGFNNIILYPNL